MTSVHQNLGGVTFLLVAVSLSVSNTDVLFENVKEISPAFPFPHGTVNLAKTNELIMQSQ